MRRTGSAVLAIALIASAALHANAAPSLTQKKSLKIYRSVLINGVHVEAGLYRVELAPSLDTVSFSKAGKAIVSAPCKVGVVSAPVIGDTVHYRAREDGREEIVRIVFAGSSLSIDLRPEVKGPAIAEIGPQH